jgi:signal transduction histidine kinase
LNCLGQSKKSNIEYLEDERGEFKIENIVKSQNFKVSKNKIPSLGFTKNPVWTKLQLINSTSRPQVYFAQIILPYMDTVQYFVVKNNYVINKSSKMGWWSNVDNKQFNSPYHPYKITLAPNESVMVYARTVKTHGTVRIPFQINTQAEFLQDFNIKNTFFGWFLGMAFLMVLLNLFMYVLLWEKIYLSYTLYILAQVFVFILREGFHAQVFNKGWAFLTGLNIYYIGLILLTIAQLMFIHMLLRAKVTQPKSINISYKILVFFGFLMAILQIFSPNEYNIGKTYTITLLLLFFGTIGLAFTMIIFAIIKNLERKSAILYCISSLPLIVLGTVQMLGNMQILPVSTPYRGVFLILAIAYEMIVLCFWLALRFKQFSNDREKLLIEKSNQHQIALETGLKLQNQERGRLAKELHDGLGIDISIIRMKLEALGMDIKNREKDATEFSEAISQLDNLANNVRNFSLNIMPPDLEKNGIALVIENLVYNLQKLNAKIEINFTTNITETLDNNYSQNLYFIAKELINNALRHSNASIIDVELMKENNKIELKVSDNGVGYDIQKSRKNDGLGLGSIKSRVSLMNAQLDIITKPSGGVSHKIIILEK